MSIVKKKLDKKQTKAYIEKQKQEKLKKAEQERLLKEELEKNLKELTKDELKYLIQLIGRSEFLGKDLQLLYSITAKLQNQLNT